MKIINLQSFMLPKTHSGGGSLHIPVYYKNRKKYICDIHFTYPDLVYLESGEGRLVNICNLKIEKNLGDLLGHLFFELNI